MMNPYFDELGTGIERSFRATDYDESRFPDIAFEALEKDPARARVEPIEILRDVAARGPMAAQWSPKSTFGEPPITVFAAPRFIIDVYYWFDASTATHEHGFSGAFQVLGGSSLHARRSFDCRRRVNSRFLLGNVRTERCETLRAGDTRRILSGSVFAHALFHLDAPSTTVVVRTRDDPAANPQYNYEPPHVAIDPTFSPRARQLRLESLDALARMARPVYLGALDDALQDATLEDTYHFMKAHAARCFADAGSLDVPEFQDRRVVCERRHGREDIDAIVACFFESCRHSDLVQGRAETTDVEERFILAALLNAHSRKQVLEFIHSRHPDRDPVETFMTTFTAMATARSDGGATVLGFDLGDDAITLTRFLLEGVAPAELAARLGAKRNTAMTERQRADVDRFVRNLLEIPVLRILAVP